MCSWAGRPNNRNDYLAARMGGDVPAYRGLCSLVLRQVYLGINPYLKPWAVRVTRVLASEAGAAQWYPQTAPIVPEASISDAAIYVALDASGSMTSTRRAAQVAGSQPYCARSVRAQIPTGPMICASCCGTPPSWTPSSGATWSWRIIAR